MRTNSKITAWRGLILALLIGLTVTPARADLRVFATVPEWGALAKAIGGEHITLYTATHALQDPHRIEAKPSLLAQARRADLLIATGAELEIGWLPLLLRDGGNPAIQPGRPGYFEATANLPLLDIPSKVDRAQGDVHAAGNPHVHLDPRLLLRIGQALAERMGTLDPGNAARYQAAYRQFAERWQTALQRWETLAAPLKGTRVLVQHGAFLYLTTWLGMQEVGTLEPRPGIEPTRSHLNTLLGKQQQNPAKMILRAAYHDASASQWLGEKGGIPVVVLPYTVGGNAAAGDLFELFENSVQQLLKGLQ